MSNINQSFLTNTITNAVDVLRKAEDRVFWWGAAPNVSESVPTFLIGEGADTYNHDLLRMVVTTNVDGNDVVYVSWGIPNELDETENPVRTYKREQFDGKLLSDLLSEAFS